jgi:hypothetical protein
MFRWIPALLLVLSACSSQPNVDLSLARPYQIVSTQDISLHGRDRLRASIYSDAVNGGMKERAQTAMRAAWDLQRSHHVSFVIVYLNVSRDKALDMHGYTVATASYSPDGGGIEGSEKGRYWVVYATEEHLDPIAVKEAEIWEANRMRFSHGGILDGRALIALIAKQLSIPPSEVHLPGYALSEYDTHSRPSGATQPPRD